MAGTYTYEPEKISENGKDRMRFELGDTMVEGGAETSALTNEEYDVVLSMFKLPKQWKKAKLACLESICRRFAYEPDTKTGPLSFSFGERAKLWREDYNSLKEDIKKNSISVPSLGESENKSPYFYTGMMSMEDVGCDS